MNKSKISIIDNWDDYSSSLVSALASVDKAKIKDAFELLLAVYKKRAKLYVCGNGGSASIAEHFVCDHFKGVAQGGGLRPMIASLTSNFPLISAIANDFEYSQIFSYQLEGLAERGDVLCVISSSGNSPNILEVIKSAKNLGVRSIGFLGFDGGLAMSEVDVAIHVSSENYGIVEDIHQMVMHSLAQQIRLHSAVK